MNINNEEENQNEADNDGIVKPAQLHIEENSVVRWEIEFYSQYIHPEFLSLNTWL